VTDCHEAFPRAASFDGVLVADLSRVLAGPYVAMTLADLGADVVKVERPGAGDETRGWGPPWVDERSSYFVALNRNKRSMTLDFDDPADLVLAQRLAARADVLVENYRPGTLERFGLGYDQLRAVNPRLVYCSITGFGSSPAAGSRAGYDLLVQAASGLMSITGEPDGGPMKVGVALVDHICALQALVGVMAALRERERSGAGQRVEVSLLGSALAALSNQASAYLLTGVEPSRFGNCHPSVVPYRVFLATDGHFVLACGNDRQFERACHAVGRPELAADERYVTNARRVSNRDALEAVLAACFAAGSVEHWVGELVARGVPAGPINSVAEAFLLAERLGVAPVAGVDEIDEASVRSPVGLSATPTTVRRRAPYLGEHDDELRSWLSG